MSDELKDGGPPSSAETEQATLGGGCFWCLEAVFQAVSGVRRVESGYAGGHHPNPTYREVCEGTTGHAEVVQVDFDPQVVSYRSLLEIFFTIHDPTTPDRQGPDVGPQYRSIILYHSPQQETVAQEVLAEVNAALWEAGPAEAGSARAGSAEAGSAQAGPVVTELQPFEAFHLAEAEHRDFYRRNAGMPYCRIMIDPKLARLRQAFPSLAGAIEDP